MQALFWVLGILNLANGLWMLLSVFLPAILLGLLCLPHWWRRQEE